MLTHTALVRRRVLGGGAVLLGVVLIVLSMLGFAGKLGQGDPAAATGTGIPSPTAGATDDGPVTGSGTGSAPPASSTSSAAPTSATPTLDPNAKAPVTVLNGTGTGGLAAKVRDTLVAGGWEVADIGNYAGNALPASTIYYQDTDQNAVAASANLQKQFPQLTRREPIPPGSGFTGVTVILTGDWSP